MRARDGHPWAAEELTWPRSLTRTRRPPSGHGVADAAGLAEEIRALRDRSNYQEADALYQAIQPDLERMRESLIDLPRTQKLTDAADGFARVCWGQRCRWEHSGRHGGAFRLSMIWSENRFPLFGIMLYPEKSFGVKSRSSTFHSP